MLHQNICPYRAPSCDSWLFLLPLCPDRIEGQKLKKNMSRIFFCIFCYRDISFNIKKLVHTKILSLIGHKSIRNGSFPKVHTFCSTTMPGFLGAKISRIILLSVNSIAQICSNKDSYRAKQLIQLPCLVRLQLTHP